MRDSENSSHDDEMPTRSRDLGEGGSETDEAPLGAVARAVGSDETLVWVKRVTLGVALAFLFGALGYAIGVRTSTPPSNEVDVGFLEDMTDHHDQAVSMALTANSAATDQTVRSFAIEVILFQRQELGLFQAYQEERGVAAPEYSLDRTTMRWMGMATPLRSMSGMASEDQMKRLDAATGIEVDKLFLELMMSHHVGGAHMSDYAAQHAADPKIRELAERMAKNQRVEVNEYQGQLDRLNTQK